MAAVVAVAIVLLTAFIGLATEVGANLLPKSWDWLQNPAIVFGGGGAALLVLIGAVIIERNLALGDGGDQIEDGAKGASGRQSNNYGDRITVDSNSGTIVNAPGATIHAICGAEKPSAGPAEKSPDNLGEASRIRYSNLPPRNQFFTGRQDFLDRLEGRTGLDRRVVILIRGLGGIGKTQVALEFAHRFKDKNPRVIVWWVRAESVVTIVEDLSSLAPVVGVADMIDQEATARKVLDILSQTPDGLLVYDNANAPSVVAPWTPTGGPKTLLTSRDRGWSGIAEQVDLPLFGRSESVAYLQRRIRCDDDTSLAVLAEELGDLPLALSQAAGYVDVNGMSISRYLDLYRDKRSAGRLLAQRLGVPDYPETVATTWLLHLDQLNQMPSASGLLMLCSFLGPEVINLDLILSEPRVLPAPLGERISDSFEREQAIGMLAKTSLVARVGDGEIVIHRLVSLVIRGYLLPAQKVVWASSAIFTLYNAFPERPADKREWATCSALAHHAVAAISRISELPPSPELAESPALSAAVGLRVLVADYLSVRGEYSIAREHLLEALSTADKLHGRNTPRRSSILVSLGGVYRQMGDLAAARDYFEQALEIENQQLEPNRLSLATIMGNLGAVLAQQGDRSRAYDLQRKALEVGEEVFGRDAYEISTALNNLGALQVDLQEYDLAEVSLQRALRIKRANLSPTDPEIPMTLANLGMLSVARRRFDRGLRFYQDALALKEEVFGNKHPELAATLINMGGVRQRLGDLENARKDIERAIAIYSDAGFPNHPSVGLAYAILGLVHQDEGDLVAARDRTKDGVKVLESVYVSEPAADLAKALCQLAEIEELLGNHAEALRHGYRALKLQEIGRSGDDEILVPTLVVLSTAHEALADHGRARATLRRAADISASRLGADHDVTNQLRQLLGNHDEPGR
ncbi:tetratricopeptide repeat protein [Micromonospora sp. NPDC051141]|uniref:tetratricopeptide repeat protein n=1 Tax=Micromonospora sp. NPDC051141 TaxID=3364284 RepID=UPI0037B45107